jgi:putative membrane protein
MADPANVSDPRVRLAAERTLLAWVRTGLSMMGFGFVVARFGLFLRELAAAGTAVITHTHAPGLSLWIGTALILMGVAVNVLAASQHATRLRFIKRGEPLPDERWPLGIVVAVLLGLLGAVMAACLVFVAP